MLFETDLPCSDCGGELVERDVDPRTLSLASAIEGGIRVAECPERGARYYPEQSLSKLSISGGQIEEGG